MTDTPIRWFRDGRLARLRLQRPARHNAIAAAMWRALPDLCREIDADPEVAAVIVEGEGGQAFSAGADIAEFGTVFADAASTAAYNASVRAGLAAVEALDRPSIALLRGLCVGGGCGLALACDLRFAGDTARLGITPSRLGLAYSFADTRRLVATVGPARAKDMLFSGRLLDAAEALAIGLVDRVLPDDAVESAALDYAAGLAERAPLSLRAAKRMIEAMMAGADGDTAETVALYEAAYRSADFREGQAAFAERRPPRFRGV
ncbi:MAG: enoyl-CoA hydratase/isomerase family protein [Inquilinus limosus]|uniref:Enoyl-CoA hydratase/isomerase family protein n=1 Tax=Inquilinus limosus TaxID=171674 RepID=A0A952KEB9_9PROT|nr:enoyl-CoA hydratase/isomerase family protein [Inquilinus limosus]